MFALLLLFLSIFSLVENKFIFVTNGGSETSWGPTAECPEESRATGFQLNREDNIGISGISLLCGKPSSEAIVGTASTTEGNSGTIGPEQKCNSGSYMESFSMMIVDGAGISDMKAKCSDGKVLTGAGADTGTWGNFSEKCPDGIRGVQTGAVKWFAMDKYFAVNNVRMLCSGTQ